VIVRRSRAKGNVREDIVRAMFAERGRYAVVMRGSGSRGKTQQRLPLRVAGDVLVTSEWVRPGIQIEVGGVGKAALKELADLRDGAIPGYALAVVLFGARGESMVPKRWLLDDGNGETYTECAGIDDMLATIKGRSA
jgi:hypothetical protein